MKRFYPVDFIATQHSSASDKAKFANHFVRFVESGYRRTLFFKWFYTRLSMTFGHIAHYNIDGFYAEWFADGGECFLAHAAMYPCYGDH